MKRIIITGATGFIGVNLAIRLVKEGHEVHLLVRPGYTKWRIEDIFTEVRLYEVDFNDLERLRNILKEIKPEWIFHLAAYGAYSWQSEKSMIIQTNMIATMNLLEASLSTGFEALINTGSSSEYGYKNHAPSEEDPVDPNSYYAFTKASASIFCRYFAKQHQLNIATVRLYSAYGPYEEPKRLMPTLIVRCLKGELPDFVDPNISRDFIYIDDVVDVYLLIANSQIESHGEIYNIGTGTQTSIREVADMAKRVFNIPDTPRWGTMPNRKWDTDTWKADIHKIHTILGWHPHYTLEEGFHQMIQWFKADPQRLSFYEGRI